MKGHVGTYYWVDTVGRPRYRPRTRIGNTFEESFIGIQPGDCVIRTINDINPKTGKKYTTGHIAIYVGNNTILEASTRHWKRTSSQHGMNRAIGTRDLCATFYGMTVWDETEGVPYDPDEIDNPVTDWNQSDGLPGEPATPSPIFDDNAFFNIVARTQYTKKYTKMNVGRALLVSDFLIAATTFFVIGVEAGLYSVLGLFAKAFLIDSLIESINLCKSFTIITTKPDEIEDYIMNTLHRGVTAYDATGTYTHESRKVLMTVCRRSDAVKLKTVVKDLDPQSFVIVTNTSEIIGKGFRGV